MIQTRVFEWKEFSKPTVQIFSRYEEKQWIVTLVSPEVTRTEPGACKASFPVSNAISELPILTFTLSIDI